jgi:hypothetical protein
MTKKKKPRLPICEKMCATCPFREGSKTEFLRTHLAMSAINEASRICHSTGSNNAFHRRTGKPERLCRGARDVQLNLFFAMKFIEAPTDEAWEKKCKEMGIP